MPNCHGVVSAQIASTVMGKEFVDLDLVLILGCELFGRDINLLRLDLLDLLISHLFNDFRFKM